MVTMAVAVRAGSVRIAGIALTGHANCFVSWIAWESNVDTTDVVGFVGRVTLGKPVLPNFSVKKRVVFPFVGVTNVVPTGVGASVGSALGQIIAWMEPVSPRWTDVPLKKHLAATAVHARNVCVVICLRVVT